MRQKTFQREASLSGVGLFTGADVSITLLPAAPNSGLRFEREGLEIPALLTSVREAQRHTRLTVGLGSVQQVEHLLSALYAYGIENATIRVQGPEMPIGDGSALPFIDLMERAGVCEQECPSDPLRVQQPIFWSSGDVHLVALPCEIFRVSYTAHHARSTAFRTQYYSCQVTPEIYKAEIAPSRTFSFYEEIAPFLEKGLLRGATLESGLLIREDRVASPEGLRFPEELARHKILDLIGDLALIGRPLLAHVISIRSGHASNAAFAALLQNVVSS